MSQRVSQLHPSTHDSASRIPATSAHQPQYGPGITSSPSAQRMGAFPLPPPPPSSGRSLELPPLLRIPKGSSGSVSPSIPRSVTLPSVLNPVPEDGGQRKRRAEEHASPHSNASTLPPLLNSSGLSHLIESTDSSGRKLLTPQSPLRRATSLSQLNPSNGNANTAQGSFPQSPNSRHYVTEAGTSGNPPLPTPPMANRQGGYGFPSIVPPPADLPRRFSPEAQRYSTSPSPGYSVYDQDDNSPTGSGYLGAGDRSRGGMSVPPPVGTSGSQLSIPLTSAGGQSTYQMMTLKTTEGDVRFPVDVQAASRVADEKRKRNAGASARFRERRKKKEMEAATTISKLEQKVKDMSEDADFYKKERDVLAGIIRGMNGGERQLSARPSSPRLRRKASNPSSSTHATSTCSYNDSPHGSPEMGRNVRRRTSSFPMTQPTPVVAQPFGQGHQAHHSNYAPGPSQGPMSHQRLPSSMQMSSTTHMAGYGGPPPPGLPPPPTVMQAPPMTGPYNPFASRYDMGNSQRPPPYGK